MATATSNASWHPAFMPNSTDHAHATETTEPAFQSPIVTSAAQGQHITPTPDAPMFPPRKESLIAEDEEPAADIYGNSHSQHAPARGPEDVELDGNTGYHGEDPELHHGHEEELPSESPSRAKHLSTMSFARTVSNEVNWGDEDDEVDPTWNIQRTDSDPFKFMAQSDRTNSFPQVPPRTTDDQSLPHSHVEQIMSEAEQEPKELFGAEDDNDESAFFRAAAPQQPSGDFLKESQNESGDWFPDYEQAYGGHPRDEEGRDEEARFEEGLPLVQHEEQQDTQPTLTSNHGIFVDEETNDEGDFFSQANKADPTQEPAPEPHLERKSTMQVLNSMHFEQDQNHIQTPTITEEESMGSCQSSLERAKGGGIAVSKSTILSEVFGEPGAELHSQSDALLDSGDGDLAAKWKAALAGDEFLDDDDDELLPDDDEPAEAPAENSALDPAVLFGDDDEGFLEDTDFLGQQTSSPIPNPVTTPNGHVKGFDALGGAQRRPSSSSNRYAPAGAAPNLPTPTNSYAPSAPLLTDLSRSTTAPNGASPYTSPAIGSFQPPQPPRPDLQPKAQSFANMSKGGYSSPYDLPMEVVKPRKRPSLQAASQPIPPSAPPRSNSMISQTSPIISAGMPGPPPSSQPPMNRPSSGASPVKVVRKSQSGFFEDLPISSKPKLAPRHASAFTPPAPSPYGPPTGAPMPPPPATTPYAVPSVQQHPVQPPQPIQALVAPERVSPYASLPTGSVPVPAVASRYSPAPPPVPQSQTAPPPVAQSRYSPAPPTGTRYVTPPTSTPVLPHQPRTSSPLAHFERNQDGQPHGLHSASTSFDRRSSSFGHESSLRASHLPPTREVDESEQSPTTAKSYGELQLQPPPQPLSQSPQTLRSISNTPPPRQGPPSRLVNSPPKRPTSNYQPSGNGVSPTFAPPQRSQTQSPGSAFAGPRPGVSAPDPYKRPASTENPLSPRQVGGYSNVTMAPSYPSRPRGFSQGMNYVAPTDGREHDPLQRWKGAPIFAWGAGGSIVTSFPKDVPRYGMSSSIPSIVRSPGEIKIKSIKDVDPLQPRLASFPGPLKGKSKKKEVVTWLAAGIEILEQNALYLRSTSSLSHEDKRVEERILLWKILRVFIEHDGVLEGSPVVEKAVREVLSPGIDGDLSGNAPLYATGAELSGISHSSTTARADPVDPSAVDALRKHLLRGEREKAVWDAVDKRLWAHALLISNTVSRDLYKQVAQEFVQKEVKIIGDNTQSLAALYEIFAGNFEESIDELVPPSARAGFQMVSATNGTGPSKDALDGLDRWRETLGLVLSNRSVDDSQALTALGKLLSGYGRAEAAHICFLFARSHAIFGGIDDPQTNIVLVGSDQLRQPFDFDRELEPVLLSEVFEYGMSLANPTAIAVSSPHLAVYKLQHAKILAEHGFRDKALLYCDIISSSITSQTRRSPYHHALLIGEVDDLNKRLKQSPKDDSGSWISKPSIDKAKGSVWATFNKFVAGDDSDASGPESTAGGAPEVGPFARIAGGTPTISRSPSNAEIYGSYNDNQGMNGSTIAVPQTKTSSKYAPGSAYTPGHQEPQSASSYGSQSRRSMEGRSSNEFQRHEPQRQMSQMSDYRPSSQRSNAPNYTPQMSSSYTPQSSYTPFGNTGSLYEPASTYLPQTPLTDQAPLNIYSSPQSLNNADGQHPPEAESSFSRKSSGYEPPSDNYAPPSLNSFATPSLSYEPPASNSYEPSSSSYEPPASSGYEPPTSGYEPPSYEPATMNDEPDSPVDTRPKKKSFMDDDDDDIPALKAAQADSAAPREKTKAEKDREADEAFRRAAEADAQKAKEAAPAKKGWGLGGWFGGGSKKEADMSAQPNKPIRAKLGEASSFVYDPDLKRWVNKKAGAEQTEAKSATPPPPRASGPPRTSSVPPPSTRIPMMTPPPAGPTSSPRAVSGPSMSSQRTVSENVTSTSSPNLIQGESPPTIEGLGIGLAPPAMMRSASNGSGPPSRPGTSMSNASSIDDLLGPPAPRERKGAAAAKKKRGRGYVDVMGEK